METFEPPLSPDVAARGTGLRTGWTTGTCASAAAKAAAIGLLGGVAPIEVEVALPAGRRVAFPVEPEAPNRCVVVKDAGDDPDCTDGARMTVEVEPSAGTSTELRAGPGIGTITKPGLGLAVGGPAINPVPRAMILAALAEVVDAPVTVTFSVPGGVSILGTTGIVRPFSTSAYRASVVQQVDVAAAEGERTIVLATGSRSERAAMRLCQVPEVCIVEVGDFTGVALRRAAAAGMSRAVFVGMAGKITKLAAGVMMTHFHRSKVDGEILATTARAAGAPTVVVKAATATATARHFFEVCVSERCLEPLRLLCEQARAACLAHVDGCLDVEVVMVDFDGREAVARAA
jgi:cobalt-precorrin-5B (C1)-methyltransferase